MERQMWTTAAHLPGSLSRCSAVTGQTRPAFQHSLAYSGLWNKGSLLEPGLSRLPGDKSKDSVHSP